MTVDITLQVALVSIITGSGFAWREANFTATQGDGLHTFCGFRASTVCISTPGSPAGMIPSKGKASGWDVNSVIRPETGVLLIVRTSALEEIQ